MVNPLSGSYYAEALTDEIEKKVAGYLKAIEDRGRIIETIASGWFQGEIARLAYQKQKEIDESGLSNEVKGKRKSFTISKIYERDFQDRGE